MLLLQKTNGDPCNGLCAIEFQEWIRLSAYPAMQRTANELFCRDRPWFSQTLYDDLCFATGYHAVGGNKKFLVTHDQDRRHSYFMHTDDEKVLRAGGARLRDGKVDRRCLPAGSEFNIPLSPVRDYVPIAMKVPDCVQSPVEMFFAIVKWRFKKLLAEHRSEHVASGQASAPGKVAELAFQSFEEVGTKELVKACWFHARKSLLIWTTPVREWVQIDGWDVQGTGGGYVHKKYRG